MKNKAVSLSQNSFTEYLPLVMNNTKNKINKIVYCGNLFKGKRFKYTEYHGEFQK